MARFHWKKSGMLLGLVALAACDQTEPAPQSETPVTAEPNSYSTEIIVPGSEFHGIHGLTFGPDGQIYVGSVVGMSIYRVEPQTGSVELVEGPMTGQADDLEFGPDGSLAWTSFLLGKLHLRTPDGELKVLGENLYGINSLAFNEEGRLFGTQVFLGDALYEFDPTGETPPRLILEGLGGLNGFDFRPDGRLYGPIWFKGQIVAIDIDTKEIEVIVEGLNVPAAVNFDSNGRLFTIDNETGEVFEVSVEDKSVSLVASAPTNLDNLAFDQNDNLFVTNMSDNGIYEINPNSGDIRVVIAGPLTTPGGISYSDNQIYVADTFSLSKVDTLGGDVSDISRIISDHEYPTEVDASGTHITMTSFNAGLVQTYDKNSEKRLTRWGGFQGPTGVLELEDGAILVAEVGTGSLIRASGEKGVERETIASGIAGITDIARLSEEEVVVSAYVSGDILKVNLEDGTTVKLAEGLAGPEGLAVTPEGQILIMEVGKKRLIKLTPESGDVEELVADLPIGLPGYPLAPPSYIMSSVTLSPSGEIFLSSDIDNSILKVVAD